VLCRRTVSAVSLSDVPIPAPRVRRALFFALVLLTTFAGAALMADILRANGMTAAETAILAIFTLTFAWIAIAFWTALFGFALRLAGLDPITLRRRARFAPADDTPITTRTAVVMPVYNEDPAQVSAGLEATARSLIEAGGGPHFDFYLLSDSTDPAIAAAEQRAFLALRERLAPRLKLYYRRRERNTERKAGNIADFCRRWGRRYDFMIVLDADSVMSGRTLLALVRAMQALPRAGIIQTVPFPVGQRTLFARLVQFASRLYSPMLATGLTFWQIGAGNYWGHNAILRVAPFMQHCALPALPGDPPLGGEILSHDFVEAAFMRRAGWDVYLLPDLEGSYEGMPANVLDFAKRDRRWAQGNLQHLKLLALRGLHPLSRLHFLLGALAYVASLLWLLLLGLSTADAIGRALVPHSFFGPGYQLFPVWPVTKTEQIVSLLVVTLAMLGLPKLCGLVLCLSSRAQRAAFGGAGRLVASALIEVLFSVLLAPLMMCFHAYFVAATLAGYNVVWATQARGDRSVAWHEALRYCLAPTLLGVAWGTATFVLAPQFFWWLTPVFAGLVLAVPLTLWTSRVRPGSALKRFGLLLTPEELAPPAELRPNAAIPAGTARAGVPIVNASLAVLAPAETRGEMLPQTLEYWWSKREKRAWEAARSAT